MVVCQLVQEYQPTLGHTGDGQTCSALYAHIMSRLPVAGGQGGQVRIWGGELPSKLEENMNIKLGLS